jgi:hypothetical protein
LCHARGADVEAVNDRLAREHPIDEHYRRSPLPIRMIDQRRLRSAISSGPLRDCASPRSGSGQPQRPGVGSAPVTWKRRASDWFIVGFLALQVALPLRYYLLGGGADERFAWRMFSSQRLMRCSYEVSADGATAEIDAVLGLNPYTMDLLPRGDPDVVVAFLRWWCARGRLPKRLRRRRRRRAARANGFDALRERRRRAREPASARADAGLARGRIAEGAPNEVCSVSTRFGGSHAPD